MSNFKNGIQYDANDFNAEFDLVAYLNTLASHSPGKGSALVADDSGATVHDLLPIHLQFSTYADLRNYSYFGADIVQITGEGIAGIFKADPSDTTTADNGGTVIVAADGTRWKRQYESKLNPLWFGAVGDGTTDDTAALTNLFNTSTNVHLQQGYTFAHTGGFTLSTYWHLTGNGKLLKLSGDGVSLLCQDGTEGVIESVVVENNASGLTQNYTNNAIQIVNSTKCTVRGVFIDGAAGGGIILQGCRDSKVLYNHVYNVHDNSIMGYYDDTNNVSCDRNLIHGNVCDTTLAQDCIFLTANAGSNATTNQIFDNIITENICRRCADSPIESGIGTVRTIIANNFVEQANSPGLLVRDALYVKVCDNTVYKLGGSSAHAGIAVVNQTKGETFATHTLIEGNTVQHSIDNTHPMIQLQQSDIVVQNNYLIQDSVTPYQGYALALYGASSDIRIDGNTLIGFQHELNRVSWTGARVTMRNNPLSFLDANRTAYPEALNDSNIRYTGEITFAVNSPQTNLHSATILQWAPGSQTKDIAEVSIISNDNAAQYARMKFQDSGAVVDINSNDFATGTGSTYQIKYSSGLNGFIIQRQGATTSGLSQMQVTIRFL